MVDANDSTRTQQLERDGTDTVGPVAGNARHAIRVLNLNKFRWVSGLGMDVATRTLLSRLLARIEAPYTPARIDCIVCKYGYGCWGMEAPLLI